MFNYGIHNNLFIQSIPIMNKSELIASLKAKAQAVKDKRPLRIRSTPLSSHASTVIQDIVNFVHQHDDREDQADWMKYTEAVQDLVLYH